LQDEKWPRAHLFFLFLIDWDSKGITAQFTAVALHTYLHANFFQALQNRPQINFVFAAPLALSRTNLPTLLRI